MKKKLLFVCLGNICRSPAAEAVFLSRIRSKNIEDLFQVDSAGTGGWHVGRKADKRMIDAAMKRGILIESVARQISINDFNDFDLILTMDESNFADLNFLIKELKTKPKAKVRPMLSFANNTNLLEVPDPYYGGENGFEEVLDLLEDAVEGLLLEIT